MAQETRKRIGIIYSYDENWIGGTYYIKNLIEAIKDFVEDGKKPILVFFVTTEKEKKQLESLAYPYAEFFEVTRKPSMIVKAINKAFKLLFKVKPINVAYPKEIAEFVFPYYENEYLKSIPNKFHWIPDFQAHKLPEFFTPEELERIYKTHEHIASKKKTLILSSKDAYDTFQELYPHNQCSNVLVLNFAVTHPKYQHLDIDSLQKKYGITQPYFISPNQFWKHKNHIVLLKAAEQLRNQPFQVVFTGKEYDSRNPDYTEGLKAFVEENQLTDKIKFLGFIDRAEQLQLMNHALAVVQPSLFEGWSTVVEDAKSMNQFLILSNISIHQEQVEKNNLFFDPNDSEMLANALLSCFRNKPVIVPQDYQQSRKRFADNFIKLVLS